MVGFVHGGEGRMSNEAQLARCIALLEMQGEDLLAIKRAVEAQNGRVRKLETAMTQVRTLWTAAVVVFGIFAQDIRHKIGLP